MATSGSNKRRLSVDASIGSGVDDLVKELGVTDIAKPESIPMDIVVKPPSLGYFKFGTEGRTERFKAGNFSPESSVSNIDNVRSIFAAGLERRRRTVEFASEGRTMESEPAAKRRRFQRRNSKTPDMIVSAMTLLSADVLFRYDANASVSEGPLAPAAVRKDDDWDSGLEIAEQLVKQLQHRRMSDCSTN